MGRARRVEVAGPQIPHRRLAADGGAYSAIFDEPASVAGVLCGTSVAVKDVFDMVGQPTRLGSASAAGTAPAVRDAAIVALLRGAGASFVGKTAMHELALGATGINLYQGTPTNPIDCSRVPGGSSSGSAVAVAEGTADLALGSDTGGSTRIPAALCGVVGFKPGRNRRTQRGLFPLAPSLDHVGLLSRSVALLLRVWAVVGPTAPRPPSERRQTSVTHYWWDAGAMDGADREIAAALERAVAQLMPRPPSAVHFPFDGEIMQVSSAVLAYEAARIHERRLAEDRERLGADVIERLQWGAAISDSEYRDACKTMANIRAAYGQLIDGGVVLSPSVGTLPPSVEDDLPASISGRLARCTRLANMTGLPAVSLPLPNLLPPHVALQISGPTDLLTLECARALEAAAAE